MSNENMSQSEEYKNLQIQYRDFKRQAVKANFYKDSDAAQILERASAIEQKILEFGLANGYDLNELKEFFRDVDRDIYFEFSPG